MVTIITMGLTMCFLMSLGIEALNDFLDDIE